MITRFPRAKVYFSTFFRTKKCGLEHFFVRKNGTSHRLDYISERIKIKRSNLGLAKKDKQLDARKLCSFFAKSQKQIGVVYFSSTTYYPIPSKTISPNPAYLPKTKRHMLTIYGIPNCDTVKKARIWLQDQGVAYHFHDFKKDGLSAAIIENWLKTLSWEAIVNTKGTTYRELGEVQKVAMSQAKTGIDLLVENSSIVKRPVLERDGVALSVGFLPDRWSDTLK
jgi:arsenate reductase (glutaredoxin)